MDDDNPGVRRVDERDPCRLIGVEHVAHDTAARLPAGAACAAEVGHGAGAVQPAAFHGSCPCMGFGLAAYNYRKDCQLSWHYPSRHRRSRHSD